MEQHSGSTERYSYISDQSINQEIYVESETSLAHCESKGLNRCQPKHSDQCESVDLVQCDAGKYDHCGPKALDHCEPQSKGPVKMEEEEETHYVEILSVASLGNQSINQ